MEEVPGVGRGPEAGQRVIPLNEDALSAMQELYRRASAIGGTQPDHYVFPACENERFDPTTPQKSLAFGMEESAEGRRDRCAALPRPPAPRYYRVGGVSGQRRYHHGNCWSRLSADAGALFPHPPESQ